MIIKGLIDEDFVNYKKPSMLIQFPRCNFKCGENKCHNHFLRKTADITVKEEYIVQRYVQNNLTSAIVISGLESFDSWKDLLKLIKEFRKYTDDDIVIYSGYNENEITSKINELKLYKNIIIKFGRYISNQTPHFDDVLGIKLVSQNQYAKKIS